MPHTPDDLFERLTSLGIATTTIDHAPVFTVEESRHLRGRITGVHTKNLFLRDNKKTYFLVTLDEERQVDLKVLRTLIGAKGGLSFASAEMLFGLLGVRPGSVSPFAAVNDSEGVVTVIIEHELLSAPMINCHPLTNEKTTSIRPDDLVAFLRSTNHEPRTITLAPREAT